MTDRCTCPMVPFRDDPYFHCDWCDRRMEERAEAQALQEREDELDCAFAELCDDLDADALRRQAFMRASGAVDEEAAPRAVTISAVARLASPTDQVTEQEKT